MGLKAALLGLLLFGAFSGLHRLEGKAIAELLTVTVFRARTTS
jgi:hypothetical protein